MTDKKTSDRKINILIMLLVIFVGIIFNEVQSNVGFLNLIYSIIIIAVIYSIAAWVVFKKMSSKIENNIIAAINESATQLEKTSNKIDNQSKAFISYVTKLFKIGTVPDWILTTEQLEALELEKAKSEVWIITSDLIEDGIDGPFFKIVEKNLDRGITYRYFLPQNDVISTRSSRMKSKLKDYIDKNLFFHYLDDDFFFLFSKFDFGIINPNDCSSDRYGFMGILTPDHQKSRFQIRISDNLMDEFIGKLQKYK